MWGRSIWILDDAEWSWCFAHP